MAGFLAAVSVDVTACVSCDTCEACGVSESGCVDCVSVVVVVCAVVVLAETVEPQPDNKEADNATDSMLNTIFLFITNYPPVCNLVPLYSIHEIMQVDVGQKIG